MAALPQQPPETQQPPRQGVTALDTVLAAGTVAAGTLAPIAIAVGTEAAALAGIKKAAEALAITSSDAGDSAARLVLDALPEAPEARAADTALMRKRSAQFKIESVKRIVKGARAAMREPTKKEVIQRLEAKVRAAEPGTRRHRAASAALQAARQAGSPRMMRMRAVIQREGVYAAAHAAAQVGRANGAARQAYLELESPAGAKWVTRKDDRVTPDCAALHGKVLPHSVLRVHRPPVHANCRCELHPIQDGDPEPLSHSEGRRLIQHAVSLKESEDGVPPDAEIALLFLTERLMEQAEDGLLLWDPRKHPRDVRGRFRHTLEEAIQRGLKGLRFPDGTTVKHRPDGKIAVSSSGKITRHEDVEAAITDALDRSARKKHPDSLGGEKSFKSYEALKEPAHSGYAPDPTAPEEGEFVYEPDPTGQFPNGIAAAWRQKHETLVADALHNWKGDPTDFQLQMRWAREGEPMPSSGSGKHKRMQALALDWELRHNARPNPKPLYRGDMRDPTGEQGWSESKAVANGFAKKYGGTVTVAPKGSVRGLRIADYISSGLDEGEKEWIVNSVPALKPKAGAFVVGPR